MRGGLNTILNFDIFHSGLCQTGDFKVFYTLSIQLFVSLNKFYLVEINIDSGMNRSPNLKVHFASQTNYG